jgi:predicted TIM-barrel fold metal-dependent hydrolase
VIVMTAAARGPQPLVDHHCHGLVQRDLDRAAIERLLNEGSGRAPSGTSVFDSMLGLALRRHCAPVLDLDPFADVDSYVRRRQELGHQEVARRMLAASGVTTFVVDTGFVPEPVTGPDELGELAGGADAHEIIRLERLAEQLIAEPEGTADFAARFGARLAESAAVGAKSIAAYRVGLMLPESKPTDDALAVALARIEQESDGTFRLADPVVTAWLAWTAVEAAMPLQFHVGYGDSDVDLLDCDPLHLTGFLRATQERGVPVLLLHNYPFHRHAAYLAQVFDHVYMDVGLAVHNTGTLSRTLVAEVLELVPFGKLLYSSDAFGLAELYLLGSQLFLDGLTSVLDELARMGALTSSDADRVIGLVTHVNARRVYQLGP